jgi:hypothetical protein
VYNAIQEYGIPIECCICRELGNPLKLLMCLGCGRNGIYHEKCWDKCVSHRPNQRTTSWVRCEKVNMADYVWIQKLLDSNVAPEKQKSLHRNDIWATWFGVPFYQEKPHLYTFSRLQTLLRKHATEDGPATQHPSLISFFGDTGGGKSTLIKSLINFCAGRQKFEFPVPGNQADIEKSTSGDVHMYADPATIATDIPHLYVGKYLQHRRVVYYDETD